MRSICLRFLPVVLLTAVSSGPGHGQTPTPSPAATPAPSDIFLLDLTYQKGEFRLGQPTKITSHAGYNNQPFFLPDGHAVLYTSIRDKQADIYRYHIHSSATSQVTKTPESEYSPTLMPDGKNISVVRVEADGTQRLWKFPLAGGPPSLILENIKPVGYHWWIDKNTLALFILGGSGKPNTLQIADVPAGKAEVIAENPGRILRRIPQQNKLSFVHKVSDQEWIIKAFDLKSRIISPLIKTFSGVEDYAWTPAGVLLMGRDAKIFKWNPSKDKDWVEVADFSSAGVRRITRITVNPKGNTIAFVALPAAQVTQRPPP